MTREEAIDIIKAERECVYRQGKTGACCRDEFGCGACDLVQEDTNIMEAYDMAIEDMKEMDRLSKATPVLKEPPRQEDTSIPADSGNKREEFDAKVFLDLHNGGKTGTLVIKTKPPYDKGYFTGVSYDIVFNDPCFTATKKGNMK